uniref:Insulin-degrading enzyme n=2 Tax=Rhodosorus marinus TaxID=101924 RepID=A0A7S3EMQ8_9RHOD|mmetsp:Transcript_45602/g.177496  ORF Transcript_45602/g.177496 Transcript_45602/m.177496 type:complete len:964 (+) Transcript_45602:753-3644(+)
MYVSKNDEAERSLRIPKLDTRQYRALVLENGISVLLVSDMELHNASASMNVAVGSYSDPVDLPGLAHFCEHMLFLGTEKYPAEDSYKRFLRENGGYGNAYTVMEDTNYYFWVAAGAFPEALDRFAQFFISPLFTQSATEREINAVDSEHHMNLQSDLQRAFRLHGSFASHDHPFSKFGPGNKTSLWDNPREKRISVRDELLRFYKNNYSSNLMSLVLVAPERLDSLEKLVRSNFADIENKSIPPRSEQYEGIPIFDARSMLVHIVPVKETRELLMRWVLPPFDYRFKTDQFIAHLIGHKGKGSLLSLLIARHWANELLVRTSVNLDHLSLFDVSIELSQEGENHYLEIVQLVYGYLNLIKTHGVNRNLWEECKIMAEVAFDYREKEDRTALGARLAETMRKYPAEHYLCGPLLHFEFDEDILVETLESLNASPLYVFLTSKRGEEECDSVEEWYGTSYSAKNLEEEQVEEWRRSSWDESLSIPRPNEFIPADLSVLEAPKPGTKSPELLRDDESYRIHHLMDSQFRLPKTNLMVIIESPCVYSSPRMFVLSSLFISMLNDSLKESTYDSRIAGLRHVITHATGGILLMFEGFSDRLEKLVSLVVERFALFKPDMGRFEVMRESLKEQYDNFYKEQPYQLAMYTLGYLLEHPRWHIDAYKQEISQISFPELEESIVRMRSELFVEMLAHGNIDAEGVDGMVSVFEQKLKFRPIRRAERLRQVISELQVSPEGSLYRTTASNPDESNSAVLVYFEFGPISPRNFHAACVAGVLAQMIREPCSNQLRTVEQLGYMVHSSMTKYNNVIGLQFIVQSPSSSPQTVNDRIEAFLRTFEESVLEPMPPEQFKKYVEGLRTFKSEKDGQLSILTGRIWTEILNDTFVYDRKQEEEKALEQVTHENVVDLFRRCLSRKAGERRKLSVHVHGNQHPVEGEPETTATLIADLDLFKSKLHLHPRIVSEDHIRAS